MFPSRSYAIQNSWNCLALLSSKRKKGEEGRQAPQPQPQAAGTRKSMMEQTPFPEKRKKREEDRQAPEPQPEPGGTSKS